MVTAFGKYYFYSDPGHAWMAVKVNKSYLMGLHESDYSPYSYRNGQTLYLEEDCDAPKFIKAWMEKTGLTMLDFKKLIVEKHTDKRHPIRSYERIR